VSEDSLFIGYWEPSHWA